MSGGPLAGLKVVEWSEFISGPYCGKLLADLGAEVVKVERAGCGDKARSHGPFPQDVPDPERSGTFLVLNANKLGVTLNVRSSAGAHIFMRLIEQADVLIENHPPQMVEELGFTFDRLRELNPRLVMTSISPFGQTGPYRDYRSCDFVSFHASGMAYLNPSNGVDDLEGQPPLMGPPHQGDLVAGLTAALATMSAVLACRFGGGSQHVDVSQQEALASIARHQIGNYTVEDVPWIRSKQERPTAVSEIYHCKDGLVYLICGHERAWERWVEAMGNPDWAMSELFQDAAMRRENWDAGKALIEDWTLEHTVDEVVRLAEGARIPCRPMNTVRELLGSELMAAREYFLEFDHPRAGKLKYPGAPYKLSATPWSVNRSAPLLGEHNEEVYCGRLGYTRQELVTLRAQGVI